ncbi:MAG: FprA family A-type flavoprotein [Anaerolineae bacterium]|nr:FprA family A-type flavoprotein [Anaerolineae bacterium]
MPARKIVDGVFSVGAVDWDRRLFDALIPLPDGTSYNSYLVQGTDATALVDAVHPTMVHVLMRHLDEVGVKRLDYLVTNHAEQDHSGGIPAVLERYQMAKVVCTPKCADMLEDLLHLHRDQMVTVEDGEKLSLGDRTLEFIHAPWVHWPETMLTYLGEQRILFPCDLFGSHLATSELYGVDRGRVEEAAKRYYAEIMMPFARNIVRHLERLEGYDIGIIGPSHGPLYDDPAFIMDLYRDWVSAEPKNVAVVPYVSMHGSTKMMSDHLVSELTRHGVTVERFELTVTDPGKLAMSLVDAATILIGTPTVLAGPHPAAASAVTLINALRPKARFLGLFGSFGWGTRVDQQIANMLTTVRGEWLEPVLVKGMPRDDDLASLARLAQTVADKHREAGLL